MSNTANGKIIFYEDQVFDKMLDHSVKLPKLEVKISSQSEGMNKFVSSYEELRKVITEYIKIFESDVANLKEATRGYITVDEYANNSQIISINKSISVTETINKRLIETRVVKSESEE